MKLSYELRSILVGLCLASSLVFPHRDAQALFLGSEDAERTFDYNAEYFMHRLAYRLPWDWQALRREARAGFHGNGGSVTSEDLMLFQEAWMDGDLSVDGAWRLGFRYLTDETYDVRYDRTELSLDAPLGRGWQGRLFGEAFGHKEHSDIGFGLTRGDRRADYLSAELVLVDFTFNQKAPVGSSYDDKPYTWRVLGRGTADAFRLEGALEIDTPLDRVDESLGRRLHYRRTRLDVQADVRLGHRRLSVAGAIEEGKIHRLALPGSGVLPLAVARGTSRAWIELGDWKPGPRSSSAGLLLHYLHEGFGETPVPSLDRSDRRIDVIPYLNVNRPLSARWTISHELYLQGVSRRGRYHAMPDSDGTDDRLQAQAGFRLRYEANERTSLVLGGYVDLDHFRFGGGNVAFAIWF